MTLLRDSQRSVEDSHKPQAKRGDDARPLISICVPVYNEEKSIDRLLNRLSEFAESESKYKFEFLFTDNASTDKTFELLAEWSRRDDRIRVLRFSRNFGFQKSILVNYLNARGVAAAQIDADLQDPPELISKFLRAWENGFMVAYGVRKRLPEFFLKRWARRLYYRLVSSLSESNLPLDAGDFRLIDRTIIEELRHVKEQSPYLRGAIAAMGYAQTGIPYDREPRAAGVSKFNLQELLSLGIDGITSQSTIPLRLVTMFGVVTMFLCFFAALFYLIIYLPQRNELPSGFTTLALIGLSSLGLNAFLIGLLGEYIGRIFNNTRGLPHAIIAERIEPVAQPQRRSAQEPYLEKGELP